MYAECYHAQEAYHRLASVGKVLLWTAFVVGVQFFMYSMAVLGVCMIYVQPCLQYTQAVENWIVAAAWVEAVGGLDCGRC